MHCRKGEEVSSSLVESFRVDLGDFIGVESCVDFRTDLSLLEKEIISDRRINNLCRRRNGHDDRDSGNKKIKEKAEEYPPPIPWLARNGNLPSSQMPWVMKKYNMDDGRLIIREEKVKRHEYFQAHRSNGRLTLCLVPSLPTLDFPDDDADDVDDDDDVVDADVMTTTEEILNLNLNLNQNPNPNPNLNKSGREEKEDTTTPSTTSSDELLCMEISDGECYYESVKRNSSVFCNGIAGLV